MEAGVALLGMKQVEESLFSDFTLAKRSMKLNIWYQRWFQLPTQQYLVSLGVPCGILDTCAEPVVRLRPCRRLPHFCVGSQRPRGYWEGICKCIRYLCLGIWILPEGRKIVDQKRLFRDLYWGI